jgi:hypothetical protein
VTVPIPPAPLVTADELAAVLGMPVPSTNTDVAASADAANGWLAHFLTPLPDHSTHEWCKRAALEVSVSMYQSPRSAGGQPVNIDFQPAPYAMGASMIRRVSGLVGPCRDVNGMVG